MFPALRPTWSRRIVATVAQPRFLTILVPFLAVRFLLGTVVLLIVFFAQRPPLYCFLFAPQTLLVFGHKSSLQELLFQTEPICKEEKQSTNRKASRGLPCWP